MSKASKDVLAERQRQIEVEGWTAEHDDYHMHCELSRAAVCYAEERDNDQPSVTPYTWPWETCWWKPKSYRENLVRAGALIIAEIERLDRQ